MIDRILDIPNKRSFFLFGPRKTGKSTLLRHRFDPKTTSYYDLLDSLQYRRLLADPQLFLSELRSLPAQVKTVVVDEIQRVPELLNAVHLFLEEGRPVRFVLSGSSARKLKRGHANLLGGRAFLRHMFPLTRVELKQSFNLQQVLNRGSLPDIYLSSSPAEARELLRGYVDVYLKEEIQAEAITRKLDVFVKFLELAGDENGKVISFSTIARECGVSYNTVKQYFQVLEDTLIGFFLPAYAKSLRKRLVAHPKFYFFDLGVVKAIRRTLDVDVSPGTDEYGRAFEHFVIAEIMRMNAYKQRDLKFSFYRSSNGAEVDLIVETPLKEVYAVEIKSSQQPEREGLRGLMSFKDLCPSAKLFCAAPIPKPRKVGECHILPWEDMLKELGLT